MALIDLARGGRLGGTPNAATVGQSAGAPGIWTEKGLIDPEGQRSVSGVLGLPRANDSSCGVVEFKVCLFFFFFF